MHTPTPIPGSSKSLILLSRLLFPVCPGEGTASSREEMITEFTQMSRGEFEELLALAHSNHVVVRGLKVASAILREAQDEVRLEWAATALAAEHARIQNAASFLHAICAAFGEAGYDATVIKSLDHWPDLGSDLDLYTNTSTGKVVELMTNRFQAQIASRSWGDRLACKWNFVIPGLPESVEFHIGRLGQTGEQIALAARIPKRARQVCLEGLTFGVPAVSDRLMVSTLQRMYRHFYFRLCDVVDTHELYEADAIDYEDLRSSATESGIWEGVATYLAIVSNYVKQYRGIGFDLPQFVRDAAQFEGNRVYFSGGFLRVPILPQSVCLYGTQFTGLLRKRELQSTARLSLLPWLATAAAVGQKITGSDKGIW